MLPRVDSAHSLMATQQANFAVVRRGNCKHAPNPAGAMFSKLLGATNFSLSAPCLCGAFCEQQTAGKCQHPYLAVVFIMKKGQCILITLITFDVTVNIVDFALLLDFISSPQPMNR